MIYEMGDAAPSGFTEFQTGDVVAGITLHKQLPNGSFVVSGAGIIATTMTTNDLVNRLTRVRCEGSIGRIRCTTLVNAGGTFFGEKRDLCTPCRVKASDARRKGARA